MVQISARLPCNYYTTNRRMIQVFIGMSITGRITEYTGSTSQNAVFMKAIGFKVFEMEFTMEDDFDFHRLQGNSSENVAVAWFNDTFGYNLQEAGILTPFHWTLTASILICVNNHEIYFMTTE